MDRISAFWKEVQYPLLQQSCSRSGRLCSRASIGPGCHFQEMHCSISSSGNDEKHLRTSCSRDRELEIWNELDHKGCPRPGRAIVRSHLERIRGAGVIACLRTDSPELALESARAALESNITVLEVTMTTPAATEVIEILVREYPAALIGAGTVLSWQEAEKALRAGAKFLLSPVSLKELVVRSKDDSVLFIPGAMTPTEVVNAYNWGAEAVKLFPVGLAGGLQLVNALKRPLPHIPLIVSSGITLDMLESYLKAGAIAAVLSDAIFDRRAMTTRDFTVIEERAKAVAARASFVLRETKCDMGTTL